VAEQEPRVAGESSLQAVQQQVQCLAESGGSRYVSSSSPSEVAGSGAGIVPESSRQSRSSLSQCRQQESADLQSPVVPEGIGSIRLHEAEVQPSLVNPEVSRARAKTAAAAYKSRVCRQAGR